MTAARAVHGFRACTHRRRGCAYQVGPHHVESGEPKEPPRDFRCNYRWRRPFSDQQVPPGRYRFSAGRVGFVGQQYQAKGTRQGAILSLTPGQEVNDAVFRLTGPINTGQLDSLNRSGDGVLDCSPYIVQPHCLRPSLRKRVGNVSNSD